MLGAGAFGASMLPGVANASIQHERNLIIHNVHTGETAKSLYFADGDYQSEGIYELNFVLRDHRNGHMKNMDKDLLDLLYLLQDLSGTKQPINIYSGFRSHETNEMLRAKYSGVAKNSMHLQGKAVDFRIPSMNLSALKNAARQMGAGGIGYYPKSGFLHIDTGRKRNW